jgi:hypothetical protein
MASHLFVCATGLNVYIMLEEMVHGS